MHAGKEMQRDPSDEGRFSLTSSPIDEEYVHNIESVVCYPLEHVMHLKNILIFIFRLYQPGVMMSVEIKWIQNRAHLMKSLLIQTMDIHVQIQQILMHHPPTTIHN